MGAKVPVLSPNDYPNPSQGQHKVFRKIRNLNNFHITTNQPKRQQFWARLLFSSLGLCAEVEGRGKGADESSGTPSPHVNNSYFEAFGGPWRGLHGPSGYYMGPYGC